MRRIGLLSDTHGIVLPFVKAALQEVDEIWHAGDIGSLSVVDELRSIKPLKAVYGNIDDAVIRREFPEYLVFEIESLKVLMTHIGGYPGKYSSLARQLIELYRPGLFVCGHSHILKVMHDTKYRLLHLNPGAAGRYGMHNHITLLRFEIEGDKVLKLEIVEQER